MVFEIHEDDEDTQVDPDGPGGKFGYRIGHSDGKYKIPDRILHTLDDRNVRCVVQCSVCIRLQSSVNAMLIMEQSFNNWSWYERHFDGTSDSTRLSQCHSYHI